jgi:hypothetical protein
VAVVGDVYRFLATGDNTDGKCPLLEALVLPSGGPLPRVHSRDAVQVDYNELHSAAFDVLEITRSMIVDPLPQFLARRASAISFFRSTSMAVYDSFGGWSDSWVVLASWLSCGDNWLPPTFALICYIRG